MIFLLNNDAVLAPDVIANLMEFAATRPEAGHLACRVVRYEEPNVFDSAGLLIYPDGVCRPRGWQEKDLGQYDRADEVIAPHGCACAYRRRMLEDTGGFDEIYFCYLEDLDLGMRWGERENIRISLRRIPGDTVGLLYAYDWIWDECAVLAETISVAAAEYAFHKALSLDPRMSPESFATLLPSAIEATKEPANHVPTLEISR